MTRARDADIGGDGTAQEFVVIGGSAPFMSDATMHAGTMICSERKVNNGGRAPSRISAAIRGEILAGTRKAFTGRRLCGSLGCLPDGDDVHPEIPWMAPQFRDATTGSDT